MKAKLINLNHDRMCLYDFPRETYSFIGTSDDACQREIKLEIDGRVLKDPLIKWNEKDWEYDIEITITAKPKQEGLIIKL